jgi:hypothetical protein
MKGVTSIAIESEVTVQLVAGGSSTESLRLTGAQERPMRVP